MERCRLSRSGSELNFVDPGSEVNPAEPTFAANFAAYPANAFCASSRRALSSSATSPIVLHFSFLFAVSSAFNLPRCSLIFFCVREFSRQFDIFSRKPCAAPASLCFSLFSITCRNPFAILWANSLGLSLLWGRSLIGLAYHARLASVRSVKRGITPRGGRILPCHYIYLS